MIEETVNRLIRESGAVPAVDRGKTVLTTGEPVPADYSHTELKPDGQQRGYVVLSEEERARGFQRPLRMSYVHVGKPGPKYPLRDLTAREKESYRGLYSKFEEYPKERAPSLGRFWTEDDLKKIGQGCGTKTTVSRSIAETYARDPHFYGGTYCAGCGRHFDVGEMGEFVWYGTEERVGT